jgi:AraC-like DNA-binding protein
MRVPQRCPETAAKAKIRRAVYGAPMRVTMVHPKLSRRGGGEQSAALPADLARVVEWLRNHLDRPIELDALAAVAGVRPRTLEAQFKRFLGTTPLGWVRGARLSRAREALLKAGAQTSVTDAALVSGFSQLGRFAGQYREQFGELPSETLRRRRRSAAVGADWLDDEALRLTWRAFPMAFAVAPKECNAALQDLERAQELAPRYGLAKAMAGWCLGQRAAQHFRATPREDLARACRLAESALALSPEDALTLTLAGGALTLAHRVEEADRLIERALARDPWCPIAWVRRGWSSAYLGSGDSALGELRMALHLTPFEPLRHITVIGIGCAHFAAGRYERAALWARAGVESYPQSFWAERITIAAAALAGARAEARRMARRLMRKDPDLTIPEAVRAWPFRPAFMARLGAGLEIAGLPRA